MVRTVLFVVALAAEKAPLFLVPPFTDHVIGRVHPASLARKAAVAVAQTIAAQLTLPGVDTSLQCVPAFESMPVAGDLNAVVDRVVTLPLQQTAIRVTLLLDRPSLAGWSWVPLAFLAGTLAFPLAAFALARINTYRESSSPKVLAELFAAQPRFRSGSRELRALSMSRKRPRSPSPDPDLTAPPSPSNLPSSSSDSWISVRSRLAAADSLLRRQLLSVPQSDPDSADLHAFADLVRPFDESEVPPSFRLPCALPSFANDDLRLQPYSIRVAPPSTSWLPRKPPQAPEVARAKG